MSEASVKLASEIRKLTLSMVYRAKASHIGGAFSMADILAVLYSEVLNYKSDQPDWENRDRVLISKGHACTSVYATLALNNFIKIDELDSYAADGGRLLSHVSHKVPGVEFSTGSLGHALPFACGLSLAAKRKHFEWKTYCILSDGELDEGSNWEAIMFAAHHKLNNLIVFIDYNKIQSFGTVSEVLELEPLEDKFNAFNWETIVIDGHNHTEILNACNTKAVNKPRVIIANTIKGKGIDFMEEKLLWHYKSPSEEEYTKGMTQL